MANTVLVVEDQHNLRKLTSLALETQGFKVVEAENGLEALERLSRQKIDLVLTDWSMPEMSGEEMLRQIQRNQTLKNLPVVVLSCHNSPFRLSLEMKKLGIMTWLRKPCRVSTLQSVISDILRLHGETVETVTH